MGCGELGLSFSSSCSVAYDQIPELIDLDKLAITLLENFLLVAAVDSMFYLFLKKKNLRREYLVLLIC